jgi:diguanylate cyclase
MFRWHRHGRLSPPVADQLLNLLDRDPAAGAVDDQALDAFVRVLRTSGQCAIELEQDDVAAFADACEKWARHLIFLAPAPDAEDARTSENGRRDWAGAARFVVARRAREKKHVSKVLGDLRQSLWGFAQRLGTALLEDQHSDDRLKAQIERLHVAVERLSPEELKAEVMATAIDLSGLLSERQQHQRDRMDALSARVEELTGQLQEAREEAARDPLTRLANRRALDDFLTRMAFLRDVFGDRACLLLVDIDHFKAINDTYGHPYGDEVLKAIADGLVRTFPRKSDMVARYGGEELAVVLPDTSPEDARRLAERMLATIRGLEIRHGPATINLTASVGLAQLGRSESIRDWLQRTDRALYRAKTEGRDRVAEAGPEA